MVSTRSKHSVEPEPRKVQSSAATARTTKPSTSHAVQPSLGGGYRRSRNGQPGPTPVPELAAKTTRSRSEKPQVESSEDETARPRNGRRVGSKQLPSVEEDDERFQSAETDVETTTGTQLEAEDVERMLAIEEIPNLNGTSEKILTTVLNGQWDIRTELRKPGSKIAKNVTLYKGLFLAAKNFYGGQEYISPKVIHAVVGSDVLDPVLFKANLAVLTLWLFTVQEGTVHMFEDLKSLDRTFPHTIGEKITQDNFDLALDIRTHALLLCLKLNQDSDRFHPQPFLEHFFFEVNDGESEASYTPPENPKLRPWSGINEYQGWEHYTLKRANEILEMIKDDKAIDFDSLFEKYSWEDFTARMIEYFKLIRKDPKRQQLVEDAVNKAKDLNSFQDPLPEQEHLPLTVANSRKPEKRVKNSKRVSKRLPVSQLTGLRQVAAEQSSRRSNPLSSQPFQQLLPANDAPPHLEPLPEHAGIDASDVDLPPMSALEYAEKFRGLDQEKNKENRATVDPVAGPSKERKRSFLDRQDGAERLSWNSQGGDTQPVRYGPTEAEKRKSKKRSMHRDDDDDDFELDTRNENEDRRKRSRKDLPEHTRPQPRSSGVSTRQSNIPRNELVPDNVGLPPRHYVSPSVPPEPEEDEGAERRQSLVQKIGRIDKKTLAQKPRKLHCGRNPWTDEQSQTLVNLIGKYKTNWAAMVQASIPLPSPTPRNPCC
ncbi:hypothetical protein BDD12DRAFT_826146 [Trichophaea hybrida]|nr:hypothetical protein BDD12DRAFT_826146 [Trichophaea hybrida]